MPSWVILSLRQRIFFPLPIEPLPKLNRPFRQQLNPTSWKTVTASCLVTEKLYIKALNCFQLFTYSLFLGADVISSFCFLSQNNLQNFSSKLIEIRGLLYLSFSYAVALVGLFDRFNKVRYFWNFLAPLIITFLELCPSQLIFFDIKKSILYTFHLHIKSIKNLWCRVVVVRFSCSYKLY